MQCNENNVTHFSFYAASFLHPTLATCSCINSRRPYFPLPGYITINQKNFTKINGVYKLNPLIDQEDKKILVNTPTQERVHPLSEPNTILSNFDRARISTIISEELLCWFRWSLLSLPILCILYRYRWTQVLSEKSTCEQILEGLLYFAEFLQWDEKLFHIFMTLEFTLTKSTSQYSSHPRLLHALPPISVYDSINHGVDSPKQRFILLFME